jgi:acyl dehydratase
MFAGMTGDYNELHTNEEYMKGTQFGRRIVHGLLGLSISHGLLFRTGFLDGTAIAFVGIEDWKFIAPIYFGDTIRARVKVAGKIPSKSKKDRGIIMLYLELLNQDNVIVQSGYKTLMMKRA